MGDPRPSPAPTQTRVSGESARPPPARSLVLSHFRRVCQMPVKVRPRLTVTRAGGGVRVASHTAPVLGGTGTGTEGVPSPRGHAAPQPEIARGTRSRGPAPSQPRSKCGCRLSQLGFSPFPPRNPANSFLKKGERSVYRKAFYSLFPINL